MAVRKKLIEVALPLEAINRAATRERSSRRGHPSKLHLWWSRKPLAVCRAVLFASLIDDPDQPGVSPELLAEIDRLPHPNGVASREQPIGERRRSQLLAFIEQLIAWENSRDAALLATAQRLIRAATGDHPPPISDPFAGGGSIPLEAHRLGLQTRASDLNPVAVLITKALTDLPSQFADLPPVNPTDRNQIGSGGVGAAGLADDVRFYGAWLRTEAEQRIGHLYPRAQLPAAYGGGETPVVAWIWARTARCPNPACGALMPLVNSFALSMRAGKESWAEPVVDQAARRVDFSIRRGKDMPPEGTVGRQGARCLVCGNTTPLQYVRNEGQAQRLSSQLMAVAVETAGGRLFLPPTAVPAVPDIEHPAWMPTIEMTRNPRHMTPPLYGMTTFDRLFTARQLQALSCFSDLIHEVRDHVQRDAEACGDRDSVAYTRAVVTYLALALDKAVNFWSTLTSWKSNDGTFRGTFARQALAIVWVFAEANPFHAGGECIDRYIADISDVLSDLPTGVPGVVGQQDATHLDGTTPCIFSTDPPYYDNIPYGDLSDYFYVWLRYNLGDLYPDMMSTVLVPKDTELVADPLRRGGSEQARRYFEAGMRRVFTKIHAGQHPDYPLTIYYAYKQSEQRADTATSSGWETMLESVIGSRLTITGTWPMRTERAGRLRESGSNALASSIVLVCRPLPNDARSTTRREFLNALKMELPPALRRLQQGNIAPVDLAQAAIGPGIAIYSRYQAVLEADGTPMEVRTALQLINQAVDEILTEQEGAYDADTRWAIAWFEQHAFEEGLYGVAETLSKAKNTSVNGMVEAGIIYARGGKVRLIRRGEIPEEANQASESRLTVWELTQHLAWALEYGGEQAAAILLSNTRSLGDAARDLAYRLYTTCERKRWPSEALIYNSLVIAWPEIARLAASESSGPMQQGVDL
jgi:putative DNA methylase